MILKFSDTISDGLRARRDASGIAATVSRLRSQGRRSCRCCWTIEGARAGKCACAARGATAVACIAGAVAITALALQSSYSLRKRRGSRRQICRLPSMMIRPVIE